MTRKSLISDHRKKSRSTFSETVLPPSVRLAFKQVHINEIESAIKIVNKRLVPELELLIADDQTVRLDNVADAFTRFKNIFRSMFVEHFGGLITGGEPNTALYGRSVRKKLDPKIDAADRTHQREFKKTFKRVLGVEPLKREPGLENQLKLSSAENVEKITTISSNYFSEIEDSINRALRSGTANDTVVDEVQEIIDKAGSNAQSRAKLIATDQIQKLNGDLDRKRQQANGGSRYYWITRRNDRVRSKSNSNGTSDHQQLDGAVFEWGHPPITVFKGKRAGERNEPGQDINCKCVASMVIDDLLGKKSKRLIAAEEKTKQLIERGVL